MVTVISDKMHLSDMPCPKLWKMVKRIITYEGRKDFWVQKTLKFIRYRFCFQWVYLLLLWKWNKIEVSPPLYDRTMLYLLLCVSLKGCHPCVRFSCLVAYYVQLASLSITQIFKKLAFCLILHITSIYTIHAWQHLKYSKVLFYLEKKFRTKNVGVTYHELNLRSLLRNPALQKRSIPRLRLLSWVGTCWPRKWYDCNYIKVNLALQAC